MQGIRLEPAQDLLSNLAVPELRRLVKLARLSLPASSARRLLTDGISRHLDLDEIVQQIPRCLVRAPARQARVRVERLDRLPPRHGEAAIHVYSHSRPALGRLLLEWNGQCHALGLSNTPLFLENRWPVMVSSAGTLPQTHLYAAFVRPGRIHPNAEVPPPRTKPYMLDEGEYQLRNSRLRLELARSGPISFSVSFLRSQPPAGRPQYLFEPIA
ncbi:hypothetical protein FJY69_03890 [candidate division WOR-3 bacterium]|nr:hypothetical protein [candidate division WOR-3 bacterium]